MSDQIPEPVDSILNESIDDGPNDDSDGSALFGGWFSSFVQTAKQTVSKTTMDSIKRDLNELKNAVQNDTSNMVYSTASLVKNTFNEIGNTVTEIGSMGTNTNDQDDDGKLVDSTTDERSESDKTSATLSFDLKTINSWTNKFTNTAKSTITLVKDTLVDSIFANFPIEELEDEPVVVKNGKLINIENWKEKLHELQINPDTYCHEPTGLLEDFDTWLVKFNLINYQKQTEYLIENVPEIKKYHDELVPHKLSDSDFWHRYFYKVHQLKEKQANLIQLASFTDDETINDENMTGQTKFEKNISRSSTEDWDKMSETKKEADSKCSSDDDREWVKCD